MPNHVHALIHPLQEDRLMRFVHSWKSYTAREINRTRGALSRVWQRDYFDRQIRDEWHYAPVTANIESNPVKADLVATPEQWPCGGAAVRMDDPGR